MEFTTFFVPVLGALISYTTRHAHTYSFVQFLDPSNALGKRAGPKGCYLVNTPCWTISGMMNTLPRYVAFHYPDKTVNPQELTGSSPLNLRRTQVIAVKNENHCLTSDVVGGLWYGR